MMVQGETANQRAKVTPITDDAALKAWQKFVRAGSAHEFCSAWLDMQCQIVPKARSGIVVLRGDAGDFAPAAKWPQDIANVDHLVGAVEKALRSETGLMEPGPDGSVMLAYPVRIKSDLFGAVVIEVGEMPTADLRRAFVNTSWGAGWLEVLFRRRQADMDKAEVKATRLALDLTTAAMEQETVTAAAMSLVNETVDKLGARSAALAMRDGRKLKMLALSRTAWFQRQSHVSTNALEAMEEAIDQLRPVSYPEIQGAEDCICVAHKRMAEQASAGTILSTPLLEAGKPVGALLLEFDASDPPKADTALLLEALGAVCGSSLADKQRQDRWFAGRIPRRLAAFLKDLVDPRRVAGKLLLAVLAAAVFWLATATAPLRVTADAVVEGTIQRAIVAPTEGFLETSESRPGDIVAAGDILAQLDDRDLRLELLRLESERARAQSEYRDALARQESLDTVLLQSAINEIEAQLRLIRLQLDRLTIRAPIDGIIVAGDLTRQLGTPIEKGEQLFEIAPLGQYRVVLKVDERDVLLIEPGQGGLLSLEAISDDRLPLVVSKVTPVSTPEEGRNYFRVEAEMTQQDAPLRPGMEGVGKIVVDEASLVWVWTRPLVNWIRIQIWTRMP